MREDWQVRVKKLALAYETGWEYQPQSEEPGSVLTDIFLEMEEKNSQRLKKIWRKHVRAFLEVVPEREEEPRKLKTALSVRTPAVGDGKRLEAGARAYLMTENGAMLDFRTEESLQLTAAGLRWVICRSGLCAWLCYAEGEEFPIFPTQARDRELSHPVFRWRFRGICDGHKVFSFVADFGEEADVSDIPPGSWTVSDGRNTYPAEWTLAEGGRLLGGECPAFAQNLEGILYELRMELSAEEPLREKWMRALAGNLVLKEKEEESLEPERCLTENGSGSSRRTLPFGREPEPAACFYLACDRAAAGARGELTLRFSESCETEERLPEPEPEELVKFYKKYPWMRRAEKVQEWKADETVWEYFNGGTWCILPGSENWRIGCQAENRQEQSLGFVVPGDMRPCAVEGEEHFYLRLRIERAQGAYAAYYRKRIPVLEHIRFCVGERSFRPEESDLPDFREASDCSIYLGFDREVTCDNRWYTRGVGRSFTPDQIKGPGVRYGKEAYWVELPGEVEEIDAMLPNYVKICQETAEDGENRENIPQRIPEKTVYFVEAGEMGVLDAVSVSEACYDESGAPIQSETDAAVHFFQHFGRLLTPMDLGLLLQERYPFLKLESCVYRQEDNELEATLIVQPKKMQKQKEINLSEIRAWLRSELRQRGAMWLQDAEVKCILQGEGQQEEGER